MHAAGWTGCPVYAVSLQVKTGILHRLSGPGRDRSVFQGGGRGVHRPAGKGGRVVVSTVEHPIPNGTICIKRTGEPEQMGAVEGLQDQLAAGQRAVQVPKVAGGRGDAAAASAF